jgi:hypothetical protein
MRGPAYEPSPQVKPVSRSPFELKMPSHHCENNNVEEADKESDELGNPEADVHLLTMACSLDL